LRVHDSCCGSGCVAISVAADRPGWQVSGSDLSEGALEVARGNAAALLAPGRPGGAVVFLRSDLLAMAGGPFDLVLANPPYVSSAQTDALLGLGWSEPRMALDGGADGLDFVRRLVGEACDSVAPGGALLVEADGEQAEAVAGLFRAAGFVDIETRRDLGGKARVTTGRKPWTT
jgi:release factor glutamine methyltransferase